MNRCADTVHRFPRATLVSCPAAHRYAVLERVKFKELKKVDYAGELTYRSSLIFFTSNFLSFHLERSPNAFFKL